MYKQEERNRTVEREKSINQIMSTVSNMNLYGLGVVYRLIKGLDETEICNINTSMEQVKDKLDMQEKDNAVRTEREKEEQSKRFFAEIKERMEQREREIASFTNQERIFWNKMEKVKKMNIAAYCMKDWQMILMCKLYNNSYLDASYNNFCYGFYQGIQYTKNQTRKNKQTA